MEGKFPCLTYITFVLKSFGGQNNSLLPLCQVVPFPLFELQSKWIAGILSNRITLPSEEEMMEDVRAFYSLLESSGIPKRYTHNMGDYQVSSISLV